MAMYIKSMQPVPASKFSFSYVFRLFAFLFGMSPRNDLETFCGGPRKRMSPSITCDVFWLVYVAAMEHGDNDLFFNLHPEWCFSTTLLECWSTIGDWLVFSWLIVDSYYLYCWWTKSCTTKNDDYPMIYRVLTIPGGCLGFLPSTVSPS